MSVLSNGNQVSSNQGAVRGANGLMYPIVIQQSRVEAGKVGTDAGISGVVLCAYSSTVASGTTDRLVWAGTGTVEQAAAASASTWLMSSATGDVASATSSGAASVLVEGLTSAFAYATANVAMNGSVAVSCATPFLRVLGLKVVHSPNGTGNLGVIYASSASANSSGVPTKQTEAIDVGAGKSQSGYYAVPASRTLYIDSLDADVVASGTITIKATTSAGIVQKLFQADLAAGDSNRSYRFESGLVVNEKSQIGVYYRGAGASGAAAACLKGYIL